MISPLAHLPIDIAQLERETVEAERMVELFRRREIAERELKERGVALHAPNITSADVIKAVSKHRGITPAAIRGDARDGRTVEARHEVFYLLAQQTKANGAPRFTFTQIGVRVAAEDRRPFDHSTVLNGIARHKGRLEVAENPMPTRPVSAQRAARQRGKILHLPRAPVTVCLQAADQRCDWCEADGGAPCKVGARRG